MGTFSGNWGGDTEGSRERQKGKVGETGDRVEDRERNTLESEDRILLEKWKCSRNRGKGNRRNAGNDRRAEGWGL